MKRTISLVSNLNYIGNTGSGSADPYYTVWTARIDGHNNLRGQPQPRKVNQSLEDLRRFRGRLYCFGRYGNEREIEPCIIATCPRCGRDHITTSMQEDERCPACDRVEGY